MIHMYFMPSVVTRASVPMKAKVAWLTSRPIAETIADPHTLSVWPAAADRTAPFWSSAPMARASTEPEPAAAPSPKV